MYSLLRNLTRSVFFFLFFLPLLLYFFFSFSPPPVKNHLIQSAESQVSRGNLLPETFASKSQRACVDRLCETYNVKV